MARTEIARTSRLFAAVALTACGAAALGQADYFEGFENNGPNNGQIGPANLIAKGWIFRDQSQFKSPEPVWHDGYTMWYGKPLPYEGKGFLGAHPNKGDGKASLWAILPPVPNQQSGDFVALQVHDGSTWQEPWIELRYSPSGGTSTGSGPDAVGDFTVVIDKLDSIPKAGFVELSGEVPGGGRIAVRYGGDFVWFNGEMYTGIDALSVGPPPEPPCNLPPIPKAGETVTWTAAGGPYEICVDPLIPAGAKVIVEAGTKVVINQGRTLFVDGELIVQGTGQAPVVFQGGWHAIKAPNGTISLSHATVGCWVYAGAGGQIIAADSHFTGKAALIGSESIVIEATDEYKYIQVDRCTFEAGDVLNGIEVADGTVVARDSQFFGCGIGVLRGTLWVDNVTIDGAQVGVTREWNGQPVFIDNVTVKNNVAGPGFALNDGNYLLGPGNVMKNNKQPVSIKAGLLPGTVVPTTGNINNYVYAGLSFTPYGQLVWAALPIPYVVEGSGSPGAVHLQPGAVVKFMPNSGWVFSRSILGRPESPITLEPFFPGQKWASVHYYNAGTLVRVENAIARGMQYGIMADGSVVSYQNSLLEGNERGAHASNYGYIYSYKSRFFNNVIGVNSTPTSGGDLASPSNPNWFEGNGTAVNTGGGFDAAYSYWGHPTGPQAPQNPGGQGDPVSGGVNVIPFLTSPPDTGDAPPVVRVADTGYFHQTGDKVHIRWEAEDDGSIAGFKVQYSPFSMPGEFKDVAELPAEARVFEFDVPLREPSNLLSSAAVRIVAVDDAGQIGYDETTFQIPYHGDWTPPADGIIVDTGKVHRSGSHIGVCKTGAASLDYAYMLIDSDGGSIPLGGSNTQCLSGGTGVPYLSTDLARIAFIYYFGAGQRYQWYVSDYITIRPDPRVGNEAPTVAMTSPKAGEQYMGGSVVPVKWTASDPEGLRSFSIQASTDGGYSWAVVATDLPPGTTSFNMVLPPSQGVADARVRVIAHDTHFQASSDGTKTSFTILPGEGGGGCKPDLDGNGVLNLFDFLAFTNLFNAGDMKADFDGNGALNLFDFLAFNNAFNGGC